MGLRTRARALAAALLTVALSGGVVVAAGTSAAAETLGRCDRQTVYVDTNTTTWDVYESTAPGYSKIIAGPHGRCFLNQGSTGVAVKALQTALNKCYGESLAVDGSFGPATRAALVRAQKKLGIAQDGSYGPQTASSMKWPTKKNGSTTSCRKIYRDAFYW